MANAVGAGVVPGYSGYDKYYSLGGGILGTPPGSTFSEYLADTVADATGKNRNDYDIADLREDAVVYREAQNADKWVPVAIAGGLVVLIIGMLR